jgi:hypothetical protein
MVSGTPTSPTPTPAGTGVDRSTIQHAAAGLRKTGYNEPIRGDESYISNGRMDGSNQRVSGRNWTNGTFDESMERNQTRTSLYAPSNGSNLLMPISNVYQHTDPVNTGGSSSSSSYAINYPSSQQHYSSSWSSSTTYEQPQRSVTTMEPSQYRYETFRQQQSSPSFVYNNPQSYINSYATRTPAVSTMVSSEPLSPGRRRLAELNDGTKFCRELRDQGLTATQRAANLYQDETTPLRRSPQQLRSNYTLHSNDPVDQLILQMEENLASGRFAAGEDNCAKCGIPISNDMPGCKAIGNIFHVDCFSCAVCGKQLAGTAFYSVDSKPFCEADYLNTLEKCSMCKEPITKKLLRASGKTFHPECFVCVVCNSSLDGVQFTVDTENNVHCVGCYHQKFAPRCAVCGKAIVPDPNVEESVRVVAMDKSFHVKCYCCEDCGMQLSSKVEGHGCYPLDGHLYCKSCNVARIRALTA